jgi:hypothetical protein
VAELREVLDALVIRPGDTLVLRFHHDISAEEAAEIKEQLAKLLPGVQSALVNAEQMAVYRPDDGG